MKPDKNIQSGVDWNKALAHDIEAETGWMVLATGPEKATFHSSTTMKHDAENLYPIPETENEPANFDDPESVKKENEEKLELVIKWKNANFTLHADSQPSDWNDAQAKLTGKIVIKGKLSTDTCIWCDSEDLEHEFE